MAKAKKNEAISTFLGADAKIEGTLEFTGTIRLDGNVQGKISSKTGTLIVGEKADVNAQIDVAVCIVMGEVKGTVDATERIEVYKPGRVMGDIQAPVISIDAGVMFNGNCAMKPKTISSSEKKSSPLKKLQDSTLKK